MAQSLASRRSSTVRSTSARADGAVDPGNALNRRSGRGVDATHPRDRGNSNLSAKKALQQRTADLLQPHCNRPVRACIVLLAGRSPQPVPSPDVSPAAEPVLREVRLSQFRSLRSAVTQVSLPGTVRWSTSSGRVRLWLGAANLVGR